MSIGFLAGVRGTSVRRRTITLHPESIDYLRRKDMSSTDWLEVWKTVLSKKEYEKRCAAMKLRLFEAKLKEKNT